MSIERQPNGNSSTIYMSFQCAWKNHLYIKTSWPVPPNGAETCWRHVVDENSFMLQEPSTKSCYFVNMFIVLLNNSLRKGKFCIIRICLVWKYGHYDERVKLAWLYFLPSLLRIWAVWICSTFLLCLLRSIWRISSLLRLMGWRSSYHLDAA